MSLEHRLRLLTEGGMLRPESLERVRRILAYFSDVHGILLTEENAAAFVTHLCCALERTAKGEPVEELDPEIYEETRAEPTFEKALAVSRDLLAMNPELPESELKYITMHVGVLLTSLS